MNVASLELCQELYDLTGWDYDDAAHCSHWKGIVVWGRKTEGVPAYDLGYLMRKLPGNAWAGYAGVAPLDDNGYFCRSFAQAYIYTWAKDKDVERAYSLVADTPEDAACKLAIELIRQGILPRQGDAS